MKNLELERVKTETFNIRINVHLEIDSFSRPDWIFEAVYPDVSINDVVMTHIYRMMLKL